MRTEIELHAKKVEDDVNRTNRENTLLKIKSVIGTRMGEVRSRFDKFCNDNIPLDDGKQLDKTFASLKKDAIEEIHKDLESVEGATNLKEFSHLLLESEEVFWGKERRM